MLVVEIIFYDQACRDKYGSLDWRLIVDSTACTCVLAELWRCGGPKWMGSEYLQWAPLGRRGKRGRSWYRRATVPGGDGVWRVIELVNQRSPAPEWRFVRATHVPVSDVIARCPFPATLITARMKLRRDTMTLY